LKILYLHNRAQQFIKMKSGTAFGLKGGLVSAYQALFPETEEPVFPDDLFDFDFDKVLLLPGRSI